MFTTFLQLGFAKFIQAKVLVFSGDHFEKTKFLSLKIIFIFMMGKYFVMFVGYEYVLSAEISHSCQK